MTVNKQTFEFFYKHAGYSTPPGRVVCAANLVKAEEYAEDNGWEYIWEWDSDIDDSWMTEKEKRQEHDWLVCRLLDANGNTLESLGGIVDPTRADRRVIEAELADEAMTRELKAQQYTMSLAWGV